MITLELVGKKRNQIKRNALLGIVSGIFILIIVGSAGQMIGNTLKVILMLMAAVIFIISLFIINYSYKFKKVIGSISFSNDYIEIDIFEKKEIIRMDRLKKIRFRLDGYEGRNKSTIFENIFFPLTRLDYHSGINNFVYLNSGESTRRFEFYIPDKRTWTEIMRMAGRYKEKFL